MSKVAPEDLYEYWLDEVKEISRPESDVPYRPVIALVGIYVANASRTTEPTSYGFRQDVLCDTVARDALRLSLSSFFSDSVDETYPVAISDLRDDAENSMQSSFAYKSVMDVLPRGVVSIPENEYFLAKQVGFAGHDAGLDFKPLRLLSGGHQVFHNLYPKTAKAVRDLREVGYENSRD